MAFRVEVAPRAFNDLDEIARYIKRRGSFKRAQEWFNGMIAAIQSLEEMPGRSPIAPESENLAGEARVLLHGHRNRKYKVYYSIQSEGPSRGTVRVFHVRHWARNRLSIEEIQRLVDEAPVKREAGEDL